MIECQERRKIFDNEIELPFVNDSKRSLPQILPRVEQVVAEEAAYYEAALREAAAHRRRYVDLLALEASIISDMDASRSRAKRAASIANNAEGRQPTQRQSWRPTVDDGAPIEAGSVSKMLAVLIEQDAKRHCRPAERNGNGELLNAQVGADGSVEVW
jgi:hypothetical protein